MYEDGYIKYNEILQVIDSGIKNTFTLKTLKGREIRCTDEHYFKVLDHMLEGRGNPEKDNFVSLKKLKIGDVIYCKSEAKSFLLNINNGRKTGRREINGVQFHPFARSKKIGKYKYKRIHFSRLVFEAFINKLNIEDYINIIKYNQEKASKLIYLPMDKVIHHINFNPTDDRLRKFKSFK